MALLTPAAYGACSPGADVSRFVGAGWGLGPGNQREQSAPNARIDSGNVARLELAWAFALDEGTSPHSFPAVTPDTVFIGTEDGHLYALDRATGCQRWRRHTIAQPAAVTGSYWLFFDRYGPSGAPVWSAPTVDPVRRRIYVGTGENYSDPATDTSDAILALDMDSGAIRWRRQLVARDTWNAACALPLSPACPKEEGPDFDFGAPPVLVRSALGRELLLAGQKSGDVYALDPESGELVWQTRLGRGGKLGGIHWGMAVNEALGALFVPVSDRGDPGPDMAPGLHALSIDSGELLWSVAARDVCGDRDGCNPGISAALTVSGDLVFAATLAGEVQALSAGTGELMWSFDTWREFRAVNGGKARGAAIDVHGPMVAEDMLFVTSGYATFGQAGGNAFLAFELTEPAAPGPGG